MFAEHLGLDATDPHTFEDAVLKLAEAVLGAPLPPPAPDRLRAGLEDASNEVPGLSLLVAACLNGKGLYAAHLETVAELPFHELDNALNALYDLAVDNRQKEHVACHAAHLFRRRGAGTYALVRYAKTSGASEISLSLAVGVPLNTPELAPALRLLALCTPPNDQALAGFIARNAELLTSVQRNDVVRLVTHPVREPVGFTLDAAFDALRHIPESEDIKVLWQRWIMDGHFDGLAESGSPPYILVRRLGEAPDLSIEPWKEIVAVLLSHVRRLARATERDKVKAAVDHVMAAAREKSPLLIPLSQECRSALGAADWDHWEAAEEMSIYVDSFVTAAQTDQNWLRAYEEYEETWKAVQEGNERRSRLRSSAQGSD